MTVVHVLLASPALFLRPSLDDPLEIQVPRTWIEGLYRLTHHVARNWKLPAADEIRLHAETIAHVYDDERGRRILVVGGVALASFTQKALAGVIAHELGHFAGGDTRLSRRGRKRLLMMGLLESQFSDNSWAAFNPLVWSIRGYHLLYQLAWAACSRQQEYAADRYEVEHVGAEQAARTTILITAIERLPWSRLSSVAETCVALRLPTQRIFSEQAARARATTAADWEEACRKALRQKTRQSDSHPCLKERLKAIGIKRKQALELARTLNQSGAPARELVPEWERVEAVLMEQILTLYRQAFEAKMEFAQIALGRPVS